MTKQGRGPTGERLQKGRSRINSHHGCSLLQQQRKNPAVWLRYLAGVGPGLLILVLFALCAFWQKRYLPREQLSLVEFKTLSREGVRAMKMPTTLMDGICSGVLTVTEAAAVTLQTKGIGIDCPDSARLTASLSSQRVRHALKSAAGIGLPMK